ncbi:unnamed protein product [Prorocentrum cordatum]|uniref:Uncharacterized protein n=1 Tax=Prorocentrum cordatum TaxID=2364126 RepID=A0ABN9QMR4_9DINO|nr:unnamed protein product [Polarella glacialis]
MRAKPTPRPRIGDVPKRAGGRRASMLAWAAGGPPPWGHDRRRNRIVEMGGAGMGGERQVHPPSQRGSGIYGILPDLALWLTPAGIGRARSLGDPATPRNRLSHSSSLGFGMNMLATGSFAPSRNSNR